MEFVEVPGVGWVNEGNLDTLSGPQLAAAFHHLTGRTVRKFSSRAAGVRRVLPHLRKALGGRPSATHRHRRRRAFNYPFTGRIHPYRRSGTKRAKLINMLREGATLEECMAACEWNYKVAYENIWLLHHYLGFGLEEPEIGGPIRLIEK